MTFVSIFAAVAGFFKSATRALSPSGWALLAALIAILLLMGTCMLRDATDGDPVSRGEVVKDQKAREKAAVSRLEDVRRQDKMNEALREAVAEIPDDVPSDSRLALACQRMRNEGHTVLPAFCGPGATGQAPAGPAGSGR